VLGLLAWTTLELTVVLPLFVVRKAVSALLITFLWLILSVCLILLRRGFVRQASLAYLIGTGLTNAVALVLSGGVHSANIAMFVTLPISAAWLFGHRAMLWATALCLGSALLMALLEIGGLGPWQYFPLPPAVAWTMIVQATVISAVPVAQILKILKERLAQSQSDRAALRDYQGRLEKLVQQRTAELVVARDQAREGRDQAQAANRAKSAFLANMSHELRTPLNAILGFSNLLRDSGDFSGGRRKDLDIINRSGEHLLELINDVLDVAKIDAGHIVAESAPCDLNGLVRQILEMMQVRAREKNLELLVHESPDFPHFARTDASKLRQILINLIGNAVKFTEHGTVTLRLDGLPEDSPHRVLLRLEVEDTGSGIAAEEQARIFEAFAQVGGHGTQKGTGLGLTIVRQYVELMGGTIRLESVPGEGSLFRVELPVERAAESEAMAPHADRARVLRIEPGQPEFRILVVEDEFENRLLLRRLLEDAGFHVRVAEDGAEGVEVFQSWRPHFIWMDRRMPGMDGLEATRHIRKLDGGREVKIAAVTASVLDSQRNEILAAGLDDFLRKPYRPAEIFDCMARHLGVRYVCAEGASLPAPQAAAALRPEALAALPEELREELANALIALDAERIAGLIRGISEGDPALGGTLALLAGRFAYTPILKALQAGQRESGCGPRENGEGA
jgi:signal transduction histidine kinase/DNA-binding NarL/FixJ family response regulator